MWASGPGRQDPREALAMIERAIAGVAGRDRELELRLEAVRFMAIFMSPALLEQALGEPERFADLDGRSAGRVRAAAARGDPPLSGGAAPPPTSLRRSSARWPIRSSSRRSVRSRRGWSS